MKTMKMMMMKRIQMKTMMMKMARKAKKKTQAKMARDHLQIKTQAPPKFNYPINHPLRMNFNTKSLRVRNRGRRESKRLIQRTCQVTCRMTCRTKEGRRKERPSRSNRTYPAQI